MDQSFFKPKQEKSDHAVVYIRVSSEEQVENYSLATQEDICAKEAARKKLVIDKIFREEGRSAKTIQGRPALIQMLEYCRNCWAQAKACLSPSVKDEDAQPPKDSPPGG